MAAGPPHFCRCYMLTRSVVLVDATLKVVNIPLTAEVSRAYLDKSEALLSEC